MAPTLEAGKPDYPAEEEVKPIEARMDADIQQNGQPNRDDSDKAYALYDEADRARAEFKEWADKGFDKPKVKPDSSASAQGQGNATAGGQSSSTTGRQGN